MKAMLVLDAAELAGVHHEVGGLFDPDIML